MCATMRVMTTDNTPFQPPEGYVEDALFRGELSDERWLKRRRKYRAQERKPTFLQLSRQVRRSRTVSLGWRIRTDPNGAGVFTSRDILPGSREWPGEPPGAWAPHAWADFYFLSRKPKRCGLFYNAYAKTAWEQACGDIEEMAQAAVEAMMTPEDLEATRLRAFSKPRADGGSEMIFAPDRGADSLGGLTRQGAQAQWLRERWDQLATLVEVKTNAVLDTDYQHGVGLHLIVPDRSVDTRTIPLIIERFLDRGEVAFEDPAMDLSEQLDLVQARMQATLWRWDRRQAELEGKDMPEPDQALWPFFDTQSNALRGF